MTTKTETTTTKKTAGDFFSTVKFEEDKVYVSQVNINYIDTSTTQKNTKGEPFVKVALKDGNQVKTTIKQLVVLQ